MVATEMKKDNAPMNLLRMVFGLMTITALGVSSGTASDTNWIGKPAPELAAGEWINSRPLSLKELRGKVVLLEFWTFGCSNCRNTLPYVNAWHEAYAGQNFQVIGIHTPESEKEKHFATLKNKIDQLGIKFPVVTDNEYKAWTAYGQLYWPVMYLLDKKGIVRYIHIGEGDYEETEQHIASLIGEK